jgi:putative PIN family toxin of toxin-antitoxin system
MNREIVVIDTNVLISAALTNGITRQVLVKVLKSFTILQSSLTYGEVKSRIYKKKFDKYLSDDDRFDFLNTIYENSLVVEPTLKILDCRDPDDNKFLELALEVPAKYLITGDNDLLALKYEHRYQKLIVTPGEFLEI